MPRDRATGARAGARPTGVRARGGRPVVECGGRSSGRACRRTPGSVSRGGEAAREGVRPTGFDALSLLRMMGECASFAPVMGAFGGATAVGVDSRRLVPGVWPRGEGRGGRAFGPTAGRQPRTPPALRRDRFTGARAVVHSEPEAPG